MAHKYDIDLNDIKGQGFGLDMDFTGVIQGFRLLVNEDGSPRTFSTPDGPKPSGYAVEYIDAHGNTRHGRWNAYWAEPGVPAPFARFDNRINLGECKAKNIALHIYRTPEGYMRVELAKEATQQL